MPSTWTPQQVLAFAPDSSSDKAARDLTNTHKWVSLGCDDDSAWGECRGSGAKPYQTQIDLTEPAFKCSCPSRKFPCKHSLALFLLLATERKAFKQEAPPAWVTEWLIARRSRAEQRAAKAEKDTDKTPDPQAQAKRAASRESKVAAGVQELERWLCDLVRMGLADLQTQPYSFWSDMAARMVDAQAPGLARMIKTMAGIGSSGIGWQGRLLGEISRLHLLLQAFKRMDTLPIDLQMDVRAAIGWTQDQDELLAEQGIRDRWLVIGQQVYDEDRLRVQKTWLWGSAVNRPALILNFTHLSQPAAEAGFAPGSAIDTEIVYFPSAYPMRALIKEKQSAPDIIFVTGFTSMDQACASFAGALAANPWIGSFPMVLSNVVPERLGEQWVLCDSAGNSLSISERFGLVWELAAISGGGEINVMGEWDGSSLLPLSAWTGSRFYHLADIGKEA